MLPVLYRCVTVVPNGRVNTSPRKGTLATTLKSIVLNRPLLIFLCALTLAMTSMYMWLGTAFIYMDAYLNMGKTISIAFTLSIIAGSVAVGFWYKCANRYGKKVALGLGVVIAALAMLLNNFVEPGDSASSQFIALICILGIGMTSLNILGPALVSDIVDYGRLKFGEDSAGTYFATYMLTIKFSSGIGAALGLAIVGWYGFDPAADSHSDEHIVGLRLVMVYLPACLALISLVFITMMPINTRLHRIIQKRLSSHIQRQKECLSASGCATDERAVLIENPVVTIQDKSGNRLKTSPG